MQEGFYWISQLEFFGAVTQRWFSIIFMRPADPDESQRTFVTLSWRRARTCSVLNSIKVSITSELRREWKLPFHPGDER